MSDETAPAAAAGEAPEWRVDGQGRQYTPRKGRQGIVYRQGEETLEQAHVRDAKGPRDEKPRKRPSPGKAARKPPAPTRVDLKILEHHLAQGLAAPGIACAAVGDDWGLKHFTKDGLGGGPYLARNLVAAAEYNPWLRDQLERAVMGEAFAVKLITSLGVAGALFAYALPPVIYYMNLPVPDRARELFEIPPRRETETDARPAPPAPPETVEQEPIAVAA